MLRPLDEGAFWGGSEVRAEPPRIETHTDVLYLPRDGTETWGLYDAGGRLLPAAVDRWGVEGRLMGQSDAPAAAGAAIGAPEADYLYIGRAQLHYGHFLVETLPRLWPLAAGRERARRPRLLVHGADLDRAWGGWSGHAFPADILEALGFGQADIVRFDRPVRLGRVRIGEPALQQHAWGTPAYRELCRAVGKAAMGARAGGGLSGRLGRALGRRDRRPVWLSRSAVYSGTVRVANERELEAALRGRGFDVVHPEQLPFAGQVALFETQGAICGFAGSAFHTGVFARPGGRRIVLSLDDKVNSNFRLFDRLIGTPSRYLRVEDSALLEDLGPGHGGTPEQPFARTYALGDPERLAGALSAVLQQRP